MDGHLFCKKTYSCVTILAKSEMFAAKKLSKRFFLNFSDIPCTFERSRSTCDWTEYPGSHFNSTELTWKWKWFDYYGEHSGIPDHTYSYHGSTGVYLINIKHCQYRNNDIVFLNVLPDRSRISKMSHTSLLHFL